MYQPANDIVKSLFDLSGRVAAVTGGVRGIGLAAAQGLAEAGADVALIYNSAPAALVQEVSAKLANTAKIKVRTYCADVCNKATITSVIEQIAAEFGRLDIVVANSGIVEYGPAEDFTEAAYRNTLDVNLDGAFFTAQAAAKVFKRLVHENGIRQGKIIFTASVSSLIVNFPQKQAPYNASKAGVVQLAKCLAVEWSGFARVNCVSPGYIETDLLSVHPKEWRDRWFSMIPSNRMCQTYELKGTYVYLASDASSYMTGAELVTDGAVSISPAVAFLFLRLLADSTCF